MFIKAQLSYDFFIASFIFLIVLSILLIQFVRVSSEIEETRYMDNLIDKAYSASQVWFREGVPVDWNKTNLVILGLQDNYEINNTKMSSLNDIGYENVKYMIGLSSLEVFFRVYDESNNTQFSFGLYPENSRNVIRVERVGILNKTIAFVDTLVWE